MPVLQISILRAGTFEGTELVHDARFTIGRDAAAGIVLDGDGCAAVHARICVEDGRVLLEDAGSADGTRVNGNRLAAVRALLPRDDVGIGVYTLKFRVLAEEVDSAAAERAAPATHGEPPQATASHALSAAQTLVPAAHVSHAEPFVPLTDTVSDGLPEGLIGALAETQATALPNAAHGAREFGLLEDDFDDDDAMDEAPWSLVEHLARPQAAGGRNAVLEVIHTRGEGVIDHRIVRRGESVPLPLHLLVAVGAASDSATAPAVRMLASGVAELRLAGACSGAIVRNGTPRSVAEECDAGGVVTLSGGDAATLEMGGDRVFIAFAEAPRLLWSADDAAATLQQRRITSAAVAASVGVMACAGGVAWLKQFQGQEQTEVIIEGNREVVLPPMAMAPPLHEVEPMQQEHEPEPMPAAQPPAARRASTAAADARPRAAKPALNMLAALPTLRTDRVRDALARASDKMGLERQSRGDFKLGDLVPRGPALGLPSGGEGPLTRGINRLLRNNGSAGALTSGAPHPVRGVVVGGAKPTVRPSGGTLSKDDIQRVIAKHLHEIQFCYEKALRTQPSLAGRVALEWTINLSGRVTKVRTADSTLASDAAVNCMTAAVKTWTFPEPRGGEVTVAFPFIFNAL